MSEIEGLESPGKWNFLGINDNASLTGKAYFHVIPVPYDGTCSYRPGARFAPRAIIEASHQVELFEAELGVSPVKWGVVTHEQVKVVVDPKEMVKRVRSKVGEVLSQEGFPIVLGGEHTVSLGAVTALGNLDFTLVCLDAHADLRDTYQGSQYSHACFLRRASEMVDCVSIGVRSISEEEKDFAYEKGIKVFYAWDLFKDGIERFDLAFLPERVYLSIDVDVLDPSLVPDVGTPEPGGLGWYDTVGLLERIIKDREVVGLDVVELCPQSISKTSDFIVAKLVYRVMGLIFKISKNRELWGKRYAKGKEGRSN